MSKANAWRQGRFEIVTFERRVLVSIVGLTPQVVTETLYALWRESQQLTPDTSGGSPEAAATSGCRASAPSYYPNELHLVTTSEGAERALLTLLPDEGSGKLREFEQEYEIPPIDRGRIHLHILGKSRKRSTSLKVTHITDLRTNDEMLEAATEIARILSPLTADSGAMVHVSLAGGRKSMSFFAGYLLSLFGRPQDRLTHVLVSQAFEHHPQFFFPRRRTEVLYTPPPESKPIDASKADVALIDIPFLRLRDLLSSSGAGREPLLEFESLIAEAQRNLDASQAGGLEFHAEFVRAEGLALRLPPAEQAFLAWFARMASEGRGPIACPNEGAPEARHAEGFLREYSRIRDPRGDGQRTAQALGEGMSKSFFLEKRTRLNQSLRRLLGSEKARRYEIAAIGQRPYTEYALNIDPRRIRFQV